MPVTTPEELRAPPFFEIECLTKFGHRHREQGTFAFRMFGLEESRFHITANDTPSLGTGHSREAVLTNDSSTDLPFKKYRIGVS